MKIYRMTFKAEYKSDLFQKLYCLLFISNGCFYLRKSWVSISGFDYLHEKNVGHNY